MADPHADVKKDDHGASGSNTKLELAKLLAYTIMGLFVVVVSTVITFLNKESAEQFLNYIYGLEILAALYVAYVAWIVWKHMKKFDHHVHELEHMYEHSYKPKPKINIQADPVYLRYEKAKEHITSHYTEEWKIGVIKLDTILRDLLKKKGYIGETVSDLLKNGESKGMKSINMAWDAHKIRNQIVHEGVNFNLTSDLAMRTFKNYSQVFFNELGLVAPIAEVLEAPHDNHH